MARPHGTAGEVRVATRLAEPEALVGQVVRLGPRPGEGTARRVRAVRGPAGAPILAIEGVRNRDDARALAGWVGWCPPEEVPALPEGAWYVFQLLGRPVLGASGGLLGRVVDVEPGVASDVLVVAGGERTIRVPFVRALVGEVGPALRLTVAEAFFDGDDAP